MLRAAASSGLEGLTSKPTPSRSDKQSTALEQLGVVLVDAGVVEAAALERARRAAERTGDRLDLVLLKLGLVPEARLCTELATILALPVAEVFPDQPILPDLIDTQFVRSRKILPLQDEDASGVLLGMVDPLDTEPCEALAYLIGRPVRPCLMPATLFEKAVLALYGGADPIAHSHGVSTASHEVSEADLERLRDIANEAPVIRLVNEIIAGAVEARASDIHFEPAPEGVAVRYRIDGHLHKVRLLEPKLQAAVTSRIKIVARLDIAERRRPQDGRIRLPVRGIDIDLRVSTIPTTFGESVVLRLLDRSRVQLDFATLGFCRADIDCLSRLAGAPNGIFLVTGPTGSGKTTTLYTMLSGLNRPHAKIFTVEDPIEYQLPGINQVQVRPATGLDFPHALRSILRQDPDVIMIGEIRDLETARIAIQASLTGHLVLSTLHTNSAAATITRLLDMGLEHYLIASTLNAILAQRLVRRLCTECVMPHPDTHLWAERIARALGPGTPAEPPAILAAKGCPACRGTGFAGRLAILELMPIHERQRTLIQTRSPEKALQASACKAGMNTLYQDGLKKVWSGLTTIEEVLSTVKTEA